MSLPDGQLCLLALPPECCQGEGPEAVLYLKLICRYITDGKVGEKKHGSDLNFADATKLPATFLSLSGRGGGYPVGDIQ